MCFFDVGVFFGMDVPPPKQTRSSTNESVGHGAGAKVLAVIGVGLSGLYLLNPTMGIFELIPDNIPGIGNLDEAAATGILLYCLSVLGVRFPFGKQGAKREVEMREVGPKGDG